MSLHKTAIALLGITFLLPGCATSPLGRTQLLMQNEASLASSAAQSYQQMKKDVPISKNKALTAYVNCVVTPLTQEVVGDNWEVTLFESDEVNAFALPGGKIGVYTGILKVANNQDRLAAVIGHEIAHVLAHHANERASAATLANIGVVAIGLATNRNQNSQLAIAALGLGVQYGIIMPYSRTHETEADLLGLDIMAKAGYDPREAPKLWQAMKADKKESIPEWLSTHPSDDSRIAALQDRESEALSYMEAAHAAGKKPHCVMPK
ncbi:MAG: M48 family metallopeptidase [Thiotrichales bacterium]|jgi:predicted Zn-dependent protease|nr:M48 family metallopeptidase [Thiotrichales bacterium]